ncbi:unknown protein [Microcystis aeruginosa NIES-843]|uniref:Uncharacterized protein n=1 Tax=Microcystis aeruginosa (strain NIES-843 / IAM M-2473) TaxID=449447 RepID=B0JTP5_MICAN|nr:unknown protein [Microcystis aeruginosa NIES-843]
MRNPARERSRNLNREVWESPSVYGGEDVNLSSRLHPDWKPLGNLWVQILKPPLPCCVPDRDIFFLINFTIFNNCCNIG